MIKRAIIITIILNLIILISVPAGHGYGIMVMFEFISIPTLIKNGFDFQKEYPFESSLILIALVTLIGKLILISLLFSKNIMNKIKPSHGISELVIILACLKIQN